MASIRRPRRRCTPDERAIQNIYALEEQSEEEEAENIDDSESDCDELSSDTEERGEDEEGEEMQDSDDGEFGEHNSFAGCNGMLWDKTPPTTRRSRAVDLVRFQEGPTTNTSSIFDSFDLFVTEEIILKNSF